MHPLIPFFEPPAFDLGPVTIHGFGILVALGFWFGAEKSQKKAVRFTGDPAAADRINRLVTWLIVGTFVGGHLGDVLWYHPEDLKTDPMLIFRVWEGLSSMGGFAACVPLSVWFFRRAKKPFWPYGDALAIGFSLGWFFGRVGCFSAHDHAGSPTNFWLGVYGMCPGNDPATACHDLGLYEALFSGALWVAFELLDRKGPRFHGFYVGWLPTLYGPFRFVLDFFRHPAGPDVRYFGLTPAQYGCVALTALGVWILVTRRKTLVAAPGAAT
ncbi:MAG: prolipoprotein diacylglyceryl transferase [Myxococcota bacterium]